MEVGKFMITGIIGFVGIGLKEKVISFYQRKANKAQIPINKCESLDLLKQHTGTRFIRLCTVIWS